MHHQNKAFCLGSSSSLLWTKCPCKDYSTVLQLDCYIYFVSHGGWCKPASPPVCKKYLPASPGQNIQLNFKNRREPPKIHMANLNRLTFSPVTAGVRKLQRHPARSTMGSPRPPQFSLPSIFNAPNLLCSKGQLGGGGKCRSNIAGGWPWSLRPARNGPVTNWAINSLRACLLTWYWDLVIWVTQRP